MAITKIEVLLSLNTDTYIHRGRILMSHMHEITNKNRPVMRFIEKVCFCSRDLKSSVSNKPGGLFFDYID